MTEDELTAAINRCYLCLCLGTDPAPGDLEAVGVLLARVDDGCRCPIEQLCTDLCSPAPGDPDRRPIVTVNGHAAGCPCHPGPSRPPGLPLAA